MHRACDHGAALSGGSLHRRLSRLETLQGGRHRLVVVERGLASGELEAFIAALRERESWAPDDRWTAVVTGVPTK